MLGWAPRDISLMIISYHQVVLFLGQVMIADLDGRTDTVSKRVSVGSNQERETNFNYIKHDFVW
jgi:hypothetical protein